MVHSTASQFAAGKTKEQVFAQILEQAELLFDGQRNWVCNLSNAASLLYHGYQSLPPPSSAVNWAGFYVMYPNDPTLLVLGPFQGHVACQSIRVGRGVCGAAAAEKETKIVDNVDVFPGHIACDSNSRSEIVVPVLANGQVVAIIDIDCAELSAFGGEDRAALEKLAVLLEKSCDFPLLS